MKLLKVRWRDGEVISEEHFRALESWCEAADGLLATQSSGYGLLRLSGSDAMLNDRSGITLKNIQGTQYQLRIENFVGLTSKGRILSLLGPHQFEILLRTTERDNEGFYNIYLVPADDDGKGAIGADLTSGPVTYEPLCRAQASDPEHDGLCVARIKADGPSISFDPDYLPLCYAIDSSPHSIERFDGILQHFTRLHDSVELYSKTLVNRQGIEPIWAFSVELFRLLCRHKAVFSVRSQCSQAYFFSIQSFFDAVAGELKILAAGYKEAKLLAEVHAAINHLSHPMSAVSLDPNMGKAYDAVQQGVEVIAHLLSRFPEGPAVEAALAVKDLVFTKGTAYNKLVIHFVEEIAYTKDESTLILKLRDFSTREPSTWDIRVSLGADLPYGSLPQLNGMLRRVGVDEFDYRIECPGSVFGSGKMQKLALYLPPPLGENIENHRSRVTVSMVS